jgi:ferredoxin/flavodoxin---NADP+ reductase
MTADLYDTTIVGAGPSGLFAAFYAGLRGMRTKVIEALPEPGGQLAVLYPEKLIYDVPGHPRILAKDLVQQLMQQCTQFAPTFVFDERAETLARANIEGEDVWRLGDATRSHYSRTVIVTAGIGAFVPNRLDRPGVRQYEERGVYYFVQDKRELRGKRVLIVGGGDTAIDWALNLKDWAAEVTLIHRRNDFRAHESSVTEVRASPVRVLTPYEIKHVTGDGAVESATVFNSLTGEECNLPVDAVLMSLGFKAALGAITGWGMEMVDSRHIRVNGFMETSLPGVYAAGDLCAVAGTEPLHLIATGFGQAAIAANSAKSRIDPKARLSPGHSSDLRL